MKLFKSEKTHELGQLLSLSAKATETRLRIEQDDTVWVLK
jgi:hypothetical protein